MNAYFNKMKGLSKAPPLPDKQVVLAAFAGSCIAMVAIGFLHGLFVSKTGLPLLVAPFGASAVLVFGAMRSPLAQPRNVVGGHIVAALVGVTVYQIVGDFPMLAVSLAVPTAIALMHLTGTLHPPGGATAFLTAAGGSHVHALGYWYVLTPCALGASIMVLIALIVNNIPKKQQYPQFW